MVLTKPIFYLCFFHWTVPNKPIFGQTWRQIVCDLPICTWLASRISLQWSLGNRYYLWHKIWNPNLTYLYLDIYNGIMFVTSQSVPGWPPGSASSGLQEQYIIFDTRKEIWNLTYLYLVIHEGIMCVTSQSVPGWPLIRLQGGLLLFLILKLKSWP